MTLQRRKELDKRKASREEDRIAQSREYLLAIRRLVHSDSYPYLKAEALKVVGQVTSKPPVDGNSLIAWFSATTVQWAFDKLFKNLEFMAKHVPEPPTPSSTTKRTAK